MRRVRCRAQGLYENGRMMCTSGSMCLAVYILADRVDMAGGSDADIRSGVHEAMTVGSRTQGVVEGILGAQDRAISVNELVRHSGVVLDAAGIGCDEVLINGLDGARTKLKHQKSGPRKWTPDSCLVHMGIISACLLPGDDGGGAVACVMTHGGHSVCLWSYGIRDFGFFDPGSGEVLAGMDMIEFDELVHRTVGVRRDSDRGKDSIQADFTLLYAKEKTKVT